MFLGHDWESWRAILLLTLATIATGVVVGLVAYILQDRPEEVTCAELDMDVSKRTLVADEVAQDLDIQGQPDARVAGAVADEIDHVCARRGSSHRPVNSDLRGTIRQRLEAPGGGG